MIVATEGMNIRPTVGRTDDVDLRLLQALRSDGRATFAELGRLVGLSAPAVHDRVGKLEASGVITGYHAAVRPQAVGLGVSALVGIFQTHSANVGYLVDGLRSVPEIEDCWMVAGEEEMVVKIRAEDVDALERILARIRRITGVARTRTTIVLSTKWEGRFPLPHVAGAQSPAAGG